MIDFNKLKGFDWNRGNIFKNWLSHKVKNSEAEEIFFNKPIKIAIGTRHSALKEERFNAFGKTNEERLLSIIFTVRNDKIRIISARDMSKKERIKYEE
ncbi:MAG: BrnT family toxin [bacterium]